jgi:hypothetical protein
VDTTIHFQYHLQLHCSAGHQIHHRMITELVEQKFAEVFAADEELDSPALFVATFATATISLH